MRCIIAAEVLVLTNTYRLLFYGKSVSNITQSLDCAAFFFNGAALYPPNIYLFRVVYFLYIGLGVLGNLSFSCPSTGFKSHKKLGQLNTPFLNASDYKF